jgi:tetratricopeptide (TPR) repeat protein
MSFQDEFNFNEHADELLADGCYSEAEDALRAELEAMPADWTPWRDGSDFLTVAFWDVEEFLAYSAHMSKRLTKSINWVNESYTLGWYQLAVAECEQGRFEQALSSIDRGLHLERDHPELWNERGYLLGQLKRHAESLECYIRAASAREWAPSSHVARALRGQGVQLIDLGRPDEAEAVLRRSLELEPDSEVARHELEYLDSLRKAAESRLPWLCAPLLSRRLIL